VVSEGFVPAGFVGLGDAGFAPAGRLDDGIVSLGFVAPGAPARFELSLLLGSGITGLFALCGVPAPGFGPVGLVCGEPQPALASSAKVARPHTKYFMVYSF
jgi:hypothetical protein